MPHANIWIRRENWDSWVAEENKSELVNGLLAQYYDKSVRYAKQGAPGKPAVELGNSKTGYKDYCEHGQPKGKCLWKGCKFS